MPETLNGWRKVWFEPRYFVKLEGWLFDWTLTPKMRFGKSVLELCKEWNCQPAELGVAIATAMSATNCLNSDVLQWARTHKAMVHSYLPNNRI